MTNKNQKRCSWANSSDIMAAYHDDEWGVPQHDSRMLWEMLMLEGFQAGLSWSTVLNKREAFRKAFANFAPAKVEKFTEKDIARLLKDEGIIRARAKIEATINGAKVFCRMQNDGEDFSDYCWSFTNGKVLKGDGVSLPAQTELSVQISKDLKKRGFKFCGPTIVYAWMQAVGR
ncbi:MAG TPA: DNA-3-methyladenine glycosylase I [Drouetiella sp.]